MKFNTRVPSSLAVALAVVVLCLAFPSSPSPVNGAGLGKTACKTVTKNGHTKRVCQKVAAKPVRTPGPTPTPTLPFTLHWKARPCTVTVSFPSSPSTPQPSCADLGFSLSRNHGVITLRQKDLGHTYLLSKFGMGSTNDNASYTVTMYVKAIKSPPKDGSLASWTPTPGDFVLTAANGHPYSGRSCGLPPFWFKALYNGEWNEGWMCSDNIDPHYVVTTFTWSFTGSGEFGSPSTHVRFSIPLLDVTVKPR